MSEREAFEAWWKTVPIHRPLAHLDAWAAWNARAAIEAQRVPDGAEATAYRYCHRCGYKSETVVITKAAAPPVAQPERVTKEMWRAVAESQAELLRMQNGQAQPAERKPLSEEQIREAVTAAGMMFTHPDLNIARAIERAHGIGD